MGCRQLKKLIDVMIEKATGNIHRYIDQGFLIYKTHKYRKMKIYQKNKYSTTI